MKDEPAHRFAAVLAAVVAASLASTHAAEVEVYRPGASQGVVEQPKKSQPYILDRPIGGASREAAQAKTDSVSADMEVTPPELITFDHLRMRQPDLLVGMALQVKANKLPPSVLDDLGSSAAVKRFLDTDWKTLETKSTPAAASQKSAVGSGLVIGRTSPDVAIAGKPAPPPGPMKTMDVAGPVRNARLELASARFEMIFRGIDAEPETLDLGTVMVGERKRGVVRLIPARAGVLRVTPAKGSLLRIVELRRYTGLLRLQPVADFRTALTGATSGGAQEPTVASRASDAFDKTAPFALEVAEGQAVEVVVEFRPLEEQGFDGSPKPYASSLDVELGESTRMRTVMDSSTLTSAIKKPDESVVSERLKTEAWSARALATPTPEKKQAPLVRSVAVRAAVEGVLYGIGLAFPEPEIFAVSGLDFILPYDWYNRGKAGEATVAIQTDSLPPGISVLGESTAKVQLGEKGEKTGSLFVFHVAPIVQKQGQGDSTVRPILLKLTQRTDKGSQWSVYEIPVVVRAPMYTRGFTHTFLDYHDGFLSVVGKSTIKADGWWWWEGLVSNQSDCYKVEYSVAVPLVGGEFRLQKSGEVGNGSFAFGERRSTWSGQGMSAVLAANFARYAPRASTQPSVSLKCYESAIY